MTALGRRTMLGLLTSVAAGPVSGGNRARAACGRTTKDTALAAQLPGNIRLPAGADAVAAVDAVMAGEPAQVALHRWMAERLDWRPS